MTRKTVFLRPYVTLYVEDGRVTGGSFDGGWEEGIYAEDTETNEEARLSDKELESIANQITSLVVTVP